jgi:hypothetical protein
MANTDTRSGFRLPWSSDRAHDTHAADEAQAAAEETAEATEPAAESLAWPSTDLNARLGLTSQPRPADPSDVFASSNEAPAVPPAAEEPPMTYSEPSPSPAPVAPRKTTKLMADLTSAIRATAIAARDQALLQVDADVAQVVEQIRSGSKEGEDALRVRSDEDVARIKEWSRAEIARVKEQTENRIDARKRGLDEELAAHAAAIEARVGEVEVTAADYRSQLDDYSTRIATEQDPAHLATLAESMPEPPALEELADLADLKMPEPIVEAVAEPIVEAEPEPVVEAVVEAEPEPVVEPEAVIEPEPEPVVEPEAVIEPEPEPEPVVEPEAVFEPEPEPVVEPEPVIETSFVVEPELEAEPESRAAAVAVADPAPSPWGEPETASSWIEVDRAWATSAVDPEPESDLEGDGSEVWTSEAYVADVPRWAAGETPDGFPTSDGEAGDPVDRGAIMAALEAAAEAVVAAESAAESADQAEHAADVAETAAELLKGRAGAEEEFDPEAQAALSARMGAGGIEESYTDRLASLLPGHGEGAADGEPRVTQIIVSGLVSVASIASFKRHLGRLAGVNAVAVASGPDGEFVFNVTHRPDVSFRDAVPTMQGFGARVTSTGDGVVHVSARDPESEG